jgi:hypothetical protein
MQCDFCDRNPVILGWKYACPNFSAHMALIDPDNGKVEKQVTQMFEGAWLACDKCVVYVEEAEWEKLAIELSAFSFLVEPRKLLYEQFDEIRYHGPPERFVGI